MVKHLKSMQAKLVGFFGKVESTLQLHIKDEDGDGGVGPSSNQREVMDLNQVPPQSLIPQTQVFTFLAKRGYVSI